MPTPSCQHSDRGSNALGFHSWSGAYPLLHKIQRLEGNDNSLLGVRIVSDISKSSICHHHIERINKSSPGGREILCHSEKRGQKLLGWQRSLFGFFHNIFWKKTNEILGQSNRKLSKHKRAC